MTRKSTGLVWLLLTLVVFILDIVTKFLVIHHFALGESLNLLPVFSLTYVHNIGAAFSLFEGMRWGLALIAVGMSLIIIYLLYKNSRTQRLENFALALILGGALGNLFDRLYHGYVIDFLDFFWQIWHYPTFNLADVSICVGIFFYLISSFKGKRKAL